ncbi:MAG: 3-oxoadipate enol-lactonase [Stellaceae bacterium]
MPFIRAGGLTVHYQLEGDAGLPVVMLSNSLGTDLHMWDAQMPALLPKFRVLRYDMRGHGLTDLPPEESYSLDRLADDALALLDALKLGRVHFCGLSIGGMIGQKLGAKAGNRFLSLALCHTAMSIATPQIWADRVATVRQGGMASIVESVVQRWFTPAFHQAHPEIIAGYCNMLLRCPAAGYIGCSLAISGADLSPDAARISNPTLVVLGEGDKSVPLETGRALAKTVKGSRLVEIKHVSHISAVEQPAAFNAALTGFLK